MAQAASVIAFSAVIVMAAAGAGAVDAAPLDAAQAAGRRLYQTGFNRMGGELQGALGSGVDIAGPRIACARCHGSDGQGGREAGVTAPPLRWSALSLARRGHAHQIDRAAYDDANLLLAIRRGVDADGRALAPAMPRYALTPRDEADVLAYLRVLGTEADTDPGIDGDRVVLGGALPLSGPQADAGRAAEQAARACIDRANRNGGVFGRRIEWQVADTATVDGARQAQSLADRSFALVAPWWPGLRARDLAERWPGAPLIGPLGNALEVDRAPADIYVVASQLSDQVRVLVDAAARGELDTGSTRPRTSNGVERSLTVIAAPDPLNRDLLRAVRRQALVHPQLTVNAWPTSEGSSVGTAADAAAATAWLAELGADATQRPETVLVLGPTSWLQAAIPALSRTDPIGTAVTPPRQITFLALYPQHGQRALDSWARSTPGRRVLWAHPQLGQVSIDPTPMLLDLQAQGATLRLPAVQTLSYAAACVAVEGLRRSGRALSRASFRSALDGLSDFHTGAVPPLSFTAGNHVGHHGSGIGERDPTEPRLVPRSPWRVPDPW